MLLWTTTGFWATNAIFPCDDQNQVDKPQLDVMRDVIVENFPPVIWPDVSRVLQIETKMS